MLAFLGGSATIDELADFISYDTAMDNNTDMQKGLDSWMSDKDKDMLRQYQLKAKGNSHWENKMSWVFRNSSRELRNINKYRFIPKSFAHLPKNLCSSLLFKNFIKKHFVNGKGDKREMKR